MATPPHRFAVLDSLRGICAVMVTLFHLNAYTLVKVIPIVANAYLFVDFFFVLSGFVIAINYQERLAQGYSAKKFMLLRFGRLYPLHFVLLICFVILEFASNSPTAFAAPEKSIDTILANVFLLQSFDIYSFLTWNFPSWSIASEFWTCFLFAMIASLWPKRLIASLVLLSAVSFIIIATKSETGIGVTNDFGTLRAIIGFTFGVVVFSIWEKTKAYDIDDRFAFVAEVLCLILVIIFISSVGQNNYNLIAPFVFAIFVFVFAFERGLISRILKLQGFVALGLLSYSIYMVHHFIGKLLVYAAHYIEDYSGSLLITKMTNHGKTIDVLGVNFTQGNIWACLYLILVVSVSALTYRYIEVPSRLWFRKQVQVERP